ncbi:MAG: hypothetical protein J5814_08510 [Bacteroidaceae bacterium]|nr:hypothetical protein [Bacteroidaceae bacterium]
MKTNISSKKLCPFVPPFFPAANEPPSKCALPFGVFYGLRNMSSPAEFFLSTSRRMKKEKNFFPSS